MSQGMCQRFTPHEAPATRNEISRLRSTRAIEKSPRSHEVMHECNTRKKRRRFFNRLHADIRLGNSESSARAT